MEPGEIATVLVGVAIAGFGFAGYSIRRYDSLPADAAEWLADYFRTQANRQGDALADVLRFALPELLVSYFETTPAEEPIPVPAAKLRELAQELEDDPASSARLERQQLTAPLTSRAMAEMREQLHTLAPAFVVTPGVQEGLMQLSVVKVDSIRVQHRIQWLAGAYRIQAATAAVFGVLVFVHLFGVPVAGATAVALFIACLVSAVVLEVARGRLRSDLLLEKTAVELALR